ncbi:MFS transporter [Umezawaea sp. Da 62-37]|uniref:MFS transporter n=1 Tax=Umezawaea sp. Da 62-37 TaxID=3075927 RepID=UPI0028F7320F|nr:MFS transporter [Umezawaea sp. Da 62-37]WNV83282.1 MFS transporter [Umezawaea sp. Da 62-37]
MIDNTKRTADSRWLALVVLCTGMMMIILDQTIVNVALPAIRTDLGFGQAGLAWIVNAYLIAFGGLLLLAGRLGDLIGHKRVFVLGLVVFTVASLLCGLATSPGTLIGARFVQGVGGALATSVTLGMIVRMFPEPGERAKAIGVFSFVSAAGASIGLLLGGVLTQLLNWHWIFFVNIPVGVVAVLAAVRLVPGAPGIGLGKGADVVGAVLITSSVMLGVYTIVEVETHGWVSAHTLVLGALAIALLGGFAVRQAKAANPLLPLRVLRSRNVVGANGTQILLVAGMLGMFFLGALYMQLVLGYDAMEVGLAFLPLAVSIGTLSVGFSARLNARFGEPRVLLAGMALILVGLLMFTRAPADGDYVRHLLPVVLPLGIGFGMASPALTTLAMSGATPGDAGLASGLVNTTMQVGGALGLAVLATTSTSRTTALLAEGVPTAQALTSGFHLAFGISATLVALAAVVAVTVIRPIPATAGAPLPVAVG